MPQLTVLMQGNVFPWHPSSSTLSRGAQVLHKRPSTSGDPFPPVTPGESLIPAPALVGDSETLQGTQETCMGTPVIEARLLPQEVHPRDGRLLCMLCLLPASQSCSTIRREVPPEACCCHERGHVKTEDNQSLVSVEEPSEASFEAPPLLTPLHALQGASTPCVGHLYSVCSRCTGKALDPHVGVRMFLL